MNLLSLSLEKIYSARAQRRKSLLKYSFALSQKGVNCQNCEGSCCTFRANSMMVTPVEAIDLYFFLNEKKMWNAQLKEKISLCIREFRLDKSFDLGRGRALRHTYTCPLFLNKFPGCPLDFEAKPYGCLGFNPLSSPSFGEREKSCHSSLEVLKEREGDDPQEEEVNQRIREKFKFHWEKLSIPLALREMDFLN